MEGMNKIQTINLSIRSLSMKAKHFANRKILPLLATLLLGVTVILAACAPAAQALPTQGLPASPTSQPSATPVEASPTPPPSATPDEASPTPPPSAVPGLPGTGGTPTFS